MALSSNESVDLFAQRRLQAPDKARDAGRTRAAETGVRRFTLETQAAVKSDGQRSEAARSTADERAARTDAAPKPASLAPGRPSPRAAERHEAAAKPAAPADRRAPAKPAQDTQAPPADDAKPAAKPAPETLQAAQSGEAQATLAALGGIAEEPAEPDEESAAAADSPEAEPSALLLGPLPADPAPGAKPVASGDGAAPAIRGGASGAKAGVPVEGIARAGGDRDAQTATADFTAALTDAGAAPAPADPGLPRTGAPAATQHTDAAAPAQPSPPPVPIGQVPLTIGLRSLNGASQFEIRLDPLELGRIDVRLDIDKDRGTVSTHIVVERPETLALLQRDAGQLQQALSQAGLDAGESGINVSLRGDEASGGADAGQRDGRSRGPRQPFGDTQDGRTTHEAGPLRALRSLGSLDIRI